MLQHNYDYRSCLDASQRINWRIDDVVAGRTFDFSKPFLPEALAGVQGIRCLSREEKLKLNQIRGFSYLSIFGLAEEYIAPSVIDHAGTTVHGDDYEVRALLRFAEEETKHIQLFKWFVRAGAILKHSKLGVFLTTLCIEWFTQKLAWNAARQIVRDPFHRRGRRLRTSEWSRIAERVRSSSAAARDALVRDCLSEMKARLDPDEQTLLILRVDRELSWKDVAAVMSEPGSPLDDAAVRQRFQRLKTRLHRMARRDGLRERLAETEARPDSPRRRGR